MRDCGYQSDNFHRTHRSWAADFDYRVRVESLEAVSGYSKAGLDESSPNGLDEGDGVWLRRRRQGDVVTSFRSEDGLDWAEMASVELAGFPRLLEVGVATCAQNHEAGNTVTAVYQDLRLTGSATVVGCHLFYSLSAWDGGYPGPNDADDAAIAPDKRALLPGGVAAFANCSSYSWGLNGIMANIEGLTGLPNPSDFTFRSGNSSDLSNLTTTPDPLSVGLRPGAGSTARTTPPSSGTRTNSTPPWIPMRRSPGPGWRSQF